MLPHVRPVTRCDPNLGGVLHHEGSWDGRSVDPLLVLVEHLEGLDPRLLPQHRETLVEGVSSERRFDCLDLGGRPTSKLEFRMRKDRRNGSEVSIDSGRR